MTAIRRSAPLVVLVALVVAGCSSSGDTTATTAHPATTVETTTVAETTASAETTADGDNAVHLVVIGDSIPFAAFCDGCTGFVD